MEQDEKQGGASHAPPASAEAGDSAKPALAGLSKDGSTEIETKRLLIAKAWKRANDLPGNVFGDTMLFVNPPLNILLDLYISHREARLINVSSVCVGSGAPATTALRYISRLSDLGFVRKSEDAKDHRVHYVDLTPEGLALTEQTLDLVAEGDRRLGIDRIRLIQ